MAICASVSRGSSEEATDRTMVRARAWSFCSAMVRTPSRAAAERVPCTWKAWPNSAMPTTRTISSGRTRANSTALAPRCSRSRCRMVILLFCSYPLPGPDVPRRSGPAERAAAPGWRRSAAGGGGRGGTAGQLGADQLEQAVELVAEDHDGGDDHDGDQPDHQAVLDGGGALLLALQAVLGEGDQADEGGVGLEHACSGGWCRPGRVG